MPIWRDWISKVRGPEARFKDDTYDYQSLPSPKRQEHYQTPQTPHVSSTNLTLLDMRIVRRGNSLFEGS
jgi:hypothetical protein